MEAYGANTAYQNYQPPAAGGSGTSNAGGPEGYGQDQGQYGGYGDVRSHNPQTTHFTEAGDPPPQSYNHGENPYSSVASHHSASPYMTTPQDPPGAEGGAPSDTAAGEAKADGDKKADDGDKKADDGDKKADDGDKKADDGDKKADDGDKKGGDKSKSESLLGGMTFDRFFANTRHADESADPRSSEKADSKEQTADKKAEGKEKTDGKEKPTDKKEPEKTPEQHSKAPSPGSYGQQTDEQPLVGAHDLYPSMSGGDSTHGSVMPTHSQVQGGDAHPPAPEGYGAPHHGEGHTALRSGDGHAQLTTRQQKIQNTLDKMALNDKGSHDQLRSERQGDAHVIKDLGKIAELKESYEEYLSKSRVSESREFIAQEKARAAEEAIAQYGQHDRPGHPEPMPQRSAGQDRAQYGQHDRPGHLDLMPQHSEGQDLDGITSAVQGSYDALASQIKGMTKAGKR